MSIALTPSHPPAPRPSPLRRIPLLFLLWTAIGLSFASQFYLSSTLSGRPIAWAEAVSYALADWYVWALLSLVPLTLSRRFPIEKLRWSNNVLIHLTASITVALAYAILRALVAQTQNYLLGEPIPFVKAAQPLLFKTYHFNLIVYWVIVAIAHTASYYRKSHEHERTSLDLERRLSEARLQALQMQLNPHFLFNAMHSISALMHRDVEAADTMLARLSELLRLTLKSDGSQTIPLSQELHILQAYLDIERIRFGDRLTIDLQIDPAAQSHPVPSLILQPIVENALRHGLAPHARQGQLSITAQTTSDTLILTVTDNGGGLPQAIREGIGLSNTRTRLAELYGPRHTFTLQNHPPTGTQARITLPTS